MTLHCKSLSVPLPQLPADPLPDSIEIQWMPPGDHEIDAYDQDGEPIHARVRVTAAGAARVAELVRSRVGQAQAGHGDLPYLDFNHEDGAASGQVMAVRWGGDDPVTGGIRATVRLSDPGRAALSGRAYRRFSPSFDIDAEGEVMTAPLNMGGLVNRAAFRSIQPIAAGDSGPNHKTTMNENQQAAELAAARQKIIDLEKRFAESESAKLIQAKDAEIEGYKTRIADLEKAQREQTLIEAKAAVAQAVSEGKLAPQDKDTHAHYEQLYAANPAATRAILARLQPDPALKTIIARGSGGGEVPAPKSPAEAWNAALAAKEKAVREAAAKN